MNQLKIRAARAEAQQNLNTIYMLEQAYHSENESYVSFTIGTHFNYEADPPDNYYGNDTIGLNVADTGKLRYAYWANVGSDLYNGSTSPDPSKFTITAFASAEEDSAGVISSDGIGLGISPSACFGNRYTDHFQMNQNRESGFAFEKAGISGWQQGWFDATKQC